MYGMDDAARKSFELLTQNLARGGTGVAQGGAEALNIVC